METPHPSDIDELTPMRKHGASVTLPQWAWRIHTVTMVFLLSIVVSGFVLLALDYRESRRLVYEHEADRQRIELAKAEFSLKAAERLANLENDRSDTLSAFNSLRAEIQGMRSDVATVKQDVAVIKARMP
jgi:hypothetical protein